MIVVDGVAVIFDLDHTEGYALDTGKLLWSHAQALMNWFPPVSGNLLVTNDRRTSKEAVALDVHSGTVAWRRPGAVIGSAQGTPLIQDDAHVLHGLDRTTGADLWSLPLPEPVYPAKRDTGISTLLTTFRLDPANPSKAINLRSYAIDMPSTP